MRTRTTKRTVQEVQDTSTPGGRLAMSPARKRTEEKNLNTPPSKNKRKIPLLGKIANTPIQRMITEDEMGKSKDDFVEDKGKCEGQEREEKDPRRLENPTE